MKQGQEDIFLFPWRWHPVLWGLLVFLINPGMILVLRVVAEGDLYWTRWWSFKIGDTICLPFFAVFASLTIAGRTSKSHHRIVSSVAFQVILFVLGALIFAGIQVSHLILEDGYGDVFFLPSELWHTFMSVFLPYLLLWGFFAAIGARRNAPRLFAVAMIFAAGYAGTMVYDNFLPWQDRSPVTVNNR